MDDKMKGMTITSLYIMLLYVFTFGLIITDREAYLVYGLTDSNTAAYFENFDRRS